MAVRIASAPDVYAAPPSQVAQLAALYKRMHRQSDVLHEISGPAGPLDIARRSVFRGVGEIAAAAMFSPPGNLDDTALQIAIASSWCDFVIDQLAEDSFQRNVGLAIAAALQNATRCLCETGGGGGLDGEAFELFSELHAEAVRNGAELADLPRQHNLDRLISDYEVSGAAVNACATCEPAEIKSIERAYLDATRALDDYEPQTPDEFVRAVSARFYPDGAPTERALTKIFATSHRLASAPRGAAS